MPKLSKFKLFLLDWAFIVSVETKHARKNLNKKGLKEYRRAFKKWFKKFPTYHVPTPIVRILNTKYHILNTTYHRTRPYHPGKKVFTLAALLGLLLNLAFPLVGPLFKNFEEIVNLKALADYHSIKLSSGETYEYETTNKDLSAFFGDKKFKNAHRFAINKNDSKFDLRLVEGLDRCPQNPDGCQEAGDKNYQSPLVQGSVIDFKGLSEKLSEPTLAGGSQREQRLKANLRALEKSQKVLGSHDGVIRSVDLIEQTGEIGDQLVFSRSELTKDIQIAYEVIDRGIQQTIFLSENLGSDKQQFLLSLQNLQVLKVGDSNYIFVDQERKTAIQLGKPGSAHINIFQEPRGVIMEIEIDQNVTKPKAVVLNFVITQEKDPIFEKISELFNSIEATATSPLKIVDGRHADFLYEQTNSNFQVGFGSRATGKTSQVAFSDTSADGAGIKMVLVGEKSSASVTKNTKLQTESTLQSDISVFEDNQIALTPSPREAGGEVGQTLVDTVELKEVKTNVDVEYKVFPQGVKENIILNSSPREAGGEVGLTSDFEYALQTTGVEPKKGEDGLWYFYEKKNKESGITNNAEEPNSSFPIHNSVAQPLFHFAAPYMEDASGVQSGEVTLNITPWTGCDQHLTSNLPVGASTPLTSACFKVTISPNSDWLANPARTYPILIDPTVVDDTQAEFDSGAKNRVITASTPTVQTDYRELTRYRDTRGLWHLNETSGTTVTDGSGNSNTGTSSNMSFNTTSQRVGAASYTFNGTSSNVSVADSPTLDFTTRDSFTIELWAKHNGAISAEDYLLTKADTTNGGYKLWMDASGDFCFGVDDDATWTPDRLACTSGVDYDDSLWHHVAAVRIQNPEDAWQNIRLYIDGVEVKDDDAVVQGLESTATIANANSLYIGVDRDGTSNEWDGDIDEVRIVGSQLTDDEIRADASRFPYGLFSSQVFDLTATALGDLTWTESQIKTTDGETLSSATSLVAQWNFNETSGTTAAVAAGSCSTTCNLSLNNFASTGSQDAAVLSGWTADNRRWGAGAVMISTAATADYLYVTDPASNNLDPNSADLSFETWIKTSDATAEIFSNNNANSTACTNNGYRIGIDANGFPTFDLDTNGATAGCDVQITGRTKIIDYQWHHLAISVTRGTSATMYLDGVAIGSDTSVTSYSGITVTGTVYFGSIGDLTGIIDSSRMYARAITAAEVVSNYNSSELEFQTRSGTTSSPDSTWEAWKPSTGETQLASMDGAYLYSTSETSTVSYWPMDETTGTTANDRTGSNNGSVTNAWITDGKFGKARSFDGAGDYVLVTDNSTLDFAAADNFTLEAWARHNGTIASANDDIITKSNDGSNGGYRLYMDDSGDYCFAVDDDSTWTPDDSACTSGVDYDDNTWHHVVGVKTGTTKIELFVDGVSVASDSSIAATGTLANTASFYIGLQDGSPDNSWDGEIDEARVFNAALSQATIQQHTYEGISRYGVNTVNASTDTTLKYEGTGSEKLSFGVPKIQATTKGLWHLEETSGTTSYIKDASTNANNGTPTNTTVVNGYAGVGRNFDGAGDFISVADNATLDFAAADNFTIEAWVKHTGTIASANDYIVTKADGTNGGYKLYMDDSGDFCFAIDDDGTWTPDDSACTSGVDFDDSLWHYVVGVKTGTTQIELFVDGRNIGNTDSSIAATGTLANTGSLYIGIDSDGSSNSWDGVIDEVQVKKQAELPTQIWENYKAGRDHSVAKSVSSTDLSGSNKLPVYIAADRPGTYLQTSISENALEDYEYEASMRGLWHFDTNANTGSDSRYVKDSSGLLNHLSKNAGTTTVPGKIGSGRFFNNSPDQLGCTDANCGGTTKLDYTGSGSWSFGAWVNLASSLTYGGIISKWHDNGQNNRGYMIYYNNNSGGSFSYNLSSDGVNADGGTSSVTKPLANTWYLVVGVYDGSTSKLYVNGVLEGSAAFTAGIFNNTADLKIGCYSACGAGVTFRGIIDEPFVTTTALTAAQNRQMYEIGKRTHNITIDFGATLDSGNLITGSSDLSFTVDATTYGATNKGDNLYKGDQIIVKENVDGTEYIAQGYVTAITASSGATTVASWDAGSTFPSGGFTVAATVFKWQREFIDISGTTLTTDRNAVTRLLVRKTDTYPAANVWVDDFRYTTGYMTAAAATAMTSTAQRYFQYRGIFSSSDPDNTAILSAVTVNYTSGPTASQLMRHGAWWSNGVTQPFWWSR